MKNFKKFLIAGIATSAVVIGSSTFASAADLFEPAPVAASPFNGFFMGVHGGYGWGKTKGDGIYEYRNSFGADIFYPFDISEFGDYKQDGAILGGQAGGNYVFESGLLMGVAVSGSWANISGSLGGLNINCENDCEEGFPVSFSRSVDALGLAEARLGWATGNYAFYVSGGVAIAHYNVEFDQVEIPLAPMSMDWDDTASGWTIGVGGDWMALENVSFGASYNYVDLGSVQTIEVLQRTGVIASEVQTIGTDTNMNLHIFKLNANYHF